MKYSIDTSALIHGWRKAYPIAVFPTLWDEISGLIRTGALRATEEVKVELSQQEDELLEWVSGQEGLFVPFDESIQIAALEIQRKYPNLVDPNKAIPDADPFVIGLAQIENCIVVSQEIRSNNPAKPKIPNVCEDLGIRHIDFLQLIEQEGWAF